MAKVWKYAAADGIMEFQVIGEKLNVMLEEKGGEYVMQINLTISDAIDLRRDMFEMVSLMRTNKHE